MRRLAPCVLLTSAFALYGYALFNTAWLCDDAYISYRAVDNLLHGYGLTWNTDERVQAFTNPLWVFVNTAAACFNQESWHIYFSALAVSVVTSLAAVSVLALAVASCPAAGVFAVVALTCCRAFVDFSTSGLENPMSHLLLALFMLAFLRVRWTGPTLFAMALCAGLAMTNRMDSILLYAPVLAYAWCGERNARTTLVLISGFVPFIAWEIFSVAYYGFPFPNTAYAKLGSGVEASALVAQGLWYVWNSIHLDPLTPALITAGLFAAPFVLRDGRYTALALGGLLYLVYVVWVGGDFMQGRFLTVPLFLAVLLLVRLPSPRGWLGWGALLAAAVAVGASAPDLSLRTGTGYGDTNYAHFMDPHKIGNARKFYYGGSGLLAWDGHSVYPIQTWAESGKELNARGQYASEVEGAIGFKGFFSGPKVHIVDIFGLADPLLARLPARYMPGWRIGHFIRYVPRWYADMFDAMSRRLGKSVAEKPDRAPEDLTPWEAAPEPPEISPKLAGTGRVFVDFDPLLIDYYKKLSLIVRGPLWTEARWKAMAAMNLGRYDHLINEDAYRFPSLVTRQLSELSKPKPAGAPWDAAGNVRLPASGIEIVVGHTAHNSLLEFSADYNERYRVLFRNGGVTVGAADALVPDTPGKRGGGLRIFTVSVPNCAIRAGYDAVRVVAYGGDKKRVIGHLLLQ